MRKIALYFIFIFTLLSCKSEKKLFQVNGSYEYEITNDSLFKNTYLYESLGYTISDLELENCGIKLIGIDTIKDKNDDFIITIHHPILEILSKSKRIENEGAGITKKKPLEVILNKSINTNKIYIYRLEEKGKYRLLVG